MNIADLPEIRCPNCNKVIARGVLEMGLMELQCHTTRCKTMVILRALRPNQAPHDGLCGDRHANKASYLKA